MAKNVRYRQADGATLVVGVTKDLGQIVVTTTADAVGTPVKMCLENISDVSLGLSPFVALLLKRVAVGTNDGLGFVLSGLDPNGTISKPWGTGLDGVGVPNGSPTATLVGPYGAWLTTGAKGAVVTAVNALGETIASVERTFTVVALTDEWFLNWDDVPGATSYRVYVTNTPGTYPASCLYTTVPYSFSNIVRAGANVGTPPLANTTGGAAPNYGTPPSAVNMTTADKTIAASPNLLKVGQQWFFYIGTKITAGTTALGNKRAMHMAPTEV